jgi:transcriptional regulator with XRE-family HTH domain
MSKRNQTIKETKESKALKALRIKADLGIRKLAQKMNYSHTRVHQFETGREDITDVYIQIFLEATGFNHEDWSARIGVNKCEFNLRSQCLELLSEIEESKLDLVCALLKNLK